MRAGDLSCSQLGQSPGASAQAFLVGRLSLSRSLAAHVLCSFAALFTLRTINRCFKGSAFIASFFAMAASWPDLSRPLG